MPDHIHIFIGYNLNQTIPDLVENIKTSSNYWIKENRYTNFNFSWQKGYSAFTHSHSQINVVAKYVLNQNTHHYKKHLGKNTWNCLINLKYLIKMNMYSTFLMT